MIENMDLGLFFLFGFLLLFLVLAIIGIFTLASKYSSLKNDFDQQNLLIQDLNTQLQQYIQK